MKTAALKREFHNFVSDIESVLHESANLTGEEFAEAREKLQEKVDATKKSLVDMGNDISKKARKSATKANREVHEEPWKAIGTGVVAGLVLGMLFAARK